METKSKDSNLLIHFVSVLTEKLVNALLRDQQVVCRMACVVHHYNAIAGTATLYLPPDFTTISAVNYVNRTGVTIYAGQKVYLVYKYGDISQGWIANTTTANLNDISLSLYRPDPTKAPTFVYEIHNDNGMIKTTLRDLSELQNIDLFYVEMIQTNFMGHLWEHQFDVGLGKTCSIEFDGYWVQDSLHRYNLITAEKPYIFWTDNADVLYVQKWDDVSSKIQLATGVVKIATIRGWKTVNNVLTDQGLICAYIKNDGKVYYRNYCEQADDSNLWEYEKEIVAFVPPVQNIGLFRTNDYRVGFIAESGGIIHWLLTARSWSGMATPAENLALGLTDYAITVYPVIYYETFEVENISLGITEYLITILYAASDMAIRSINNVDRGDGDFGYQIQFIAQHGLTNITLSDFSLVDAKITSYTIGGITKTGPNTYSIVSSNLNNAFGELTLSFAGNSLTLGEAGQNVDPFSVSFAPVNLVPTIVEPPVAIAVSLLSNSLIQVTFDQDLTGDWFLGHTGVDSQKTAFVVTKKERVHQFTEDSVTSNPTITTVRRSDRVTETHNNPDLTITESTLDNTSGVFTLHMTN